MERETSKHGARVDDAMTKDVASLLHGNPEESRAQEARLQEDADVDAGHRPGADQAVGAGISEVDAARRAELARHLAAAAFPARRDHLVFAAEEAFAPADVLDDLRRLPADGEYENVQAVWVSLGGQTEDSHT